MPFPHCDTNLENVQIEMILPLLAPVARTAWFPPTLEISALFFPHS